jgi:hypothetical protein
VQPLSAAEIVQLWEWGQDKHPVDRALALLTLALPELEAEQIADLSVGQRNLCLLLLRRQMFGPVLNGYAECIHCGEKIEFDVAVSALLLPEPPQQQLHLTLAGYELQCRLPTSRDLAALAPCDDVEAVRRGLVRRCVTAARNEGQTIAADDLPDQAIAELAAAVAARDPQADMSFALTCPACGQGWAAPFDIGAFFWTELGDRVKRLLYDVHLLAQAYGWSEADVLAISPTRRQTYLDWVIGQG